METDSSDHLQSSNSDGETDDGSDSFDKRQLIGVETENTELLPEVEGLCISGEARPGHTIYVAGFQGRIQDFHQATNDHATRSTSFGFGFRIEDLRQPSYQRADPNYVMLTPSKEHLAEGILKDLGKRPMFQSEVDSGNYDHLPRELKPIGKIF